MALGQNYLGSAYLGQGFAGATLPVLIDEGLWIYSTPTGTLQSASVTQFLELHGVQVIGQGSPVVTISGGLTTWQTLGEVDQPFVAPANVGWLRIPLTSTELAPTTESGWENASPITVEVYTDSGGVPGTLVASTVIPAEQIESVQLATWPEPDDLLFGVAVADTQASLPQLPGTGWTGITTLVAGAWGALFATQGSNATQMWISQFDGQDLGGWIAGSTLPVNGVSQVVYAPTAQVIVILSGGLLWAASFSQTGVVGSWQQLPAVGDAVLIGVLTYESVDYLIAIASNGLTSYASLSTSANIGAWASRPSFPVGFTSGESYQVGTDLVVVVQSSGTLTLVSLSAPDGGWVLSGTLPPSSSDVLGIIGESIVTTDGTTIFATALTETGTSPWSLPVPLSASGSNVTLLAFDIGAQFVVFWVSTTSGVVGFQQQAYIPSWASVPLPLSLTIGNTYHLVLSASNSLTVGVAVPVANPSGSEIAGLIYVNGWVALGGVVPFLALYGENVPVALIASGKTTVVWFDSPSGVLTSVVELVDGTSNSRALTYTENVLSEVA